MHEKLYTSSNISVNLLIFFPFQLRIRLAREKVYL